MNPGPLAHLGEPGKFKAKRTLNLKLPESTQATRALDPKEKDPT